MYKKPYQPLLLTTSKYGALDYGTKFFRDEVNPKVQIGGVRLSFSYFFNGILSRDGLLMILIVFFFLFKRFKTLVPPVPEFHKLNRTYADSSFYMA